MSGHDANRPTPTDQDRRKATEALGELAEARPDTVEAVAQLLADDRQATVGRILRACEDALGG